MFAKNIGTPDRILRLLLGVGLLLWFFFDQGSGPWHYAKLIGVIPLLTGLLSSCPLYSALGVSTCPVKRA